MAVLFISRPLEYSFHDDQKSFSNFLKLVIGMLGEVGYFSSRLMFKRNLRGLRSRDFN